MNIPYYRQQKEKAMERERREKMTKCRNARNVDPECNKYEYYRSGAGNNGGEMMMALVPVVVMLLAER